MENINMEVRLARIEQKVDKLTDAITMLARIEERMLAQNETNIRFGTRLDTHDGRLRVLETKIAGSAWVERLLWVILATGIALTIK